jgi:hypothetical protein
MKAAMKEKAIMGISSVMLVAVLLLIGLIGLSTMAGAITQYDSLDIETNVTAKTLIDISPANLTWTGLEPGTISVTTKQIQLENIGSTSITEVWFNSSQPTAARPFATGDPGEYDAANFVKISFENNGAYYFVDRLEWNETRTLIYLTLAGGYQTYGRFRNGGNEYFWVTYIGTTNCTDGKIAIGTSAHNQTLDGDLDLTNNNVTLTNADGTWGYADTTIGGDSYVVLVRESCDRVRWYKWNEDAPGAASAANDAYFWDDTGAPGYPLYPGNSTVADVKVAIPYGVAYGEIGDGQLFVLAQSAEAS